MFDFSKIIGRKIVNIRGWKKRKNQARIPAEYILFDDKETYIELEEQDYYAYHDCSMSARHIVVCCDKIRWNRIATDNNIYGDANEDI